MKLINKVAVITGGAQGIGAGCARRFAREGAHLVIADINREKAQKVVADIIAAGGQAIFVPTDVAVQAEVDRLFSKTLEVFGRVDILINNAALVHYPPANVNFLELSDEVWLKNIDISLNGAFYCASRAARMMVRQVENGVADGGSIINIGSGGGTRSHRHLASYDASKGGIAALTRSCALDLAPWNIRTNTIIPGNTAVENLMGGAFGGDAAKKTIPLGRPGTPEDMAGAATYLASEDANYVTGIELVVDGGMDIQLRSPGVDRSIDKEEIFKRVFG